jgi:hypothetical protein
LTPDAALDGPAGGQVTYTLTLTNTGDLTDTFDLKAIGQMWTTTLSTSAVNTAPSAHAAFTVAVAIPPDAADQESDTATVTATSRGDGSVVDSAVLTTVAVRKPEAVYLSYLPMILDNTSKASRADTVRVPSRPTRTTPSGGTQ